MWLHVWYKWSLYLVLVLQVSAACLWFCWFLFEYTASSKHAFSYIANKNPYVREQVFGIGSNSKSFMFFSESNIDSEKEIFDLKLKFNAWFVMSYFLTLA